MTEYFLDDISLVTKVRLHRLNDEGLTNLIKAIYLSRPDLQIAIPVNSDGYCIILWKWWIYHGFRKYKVDARIPLGVDVLGIGSENTDKVACFLQNTLLEIRPGLKNINNVSNGKNVSELVRWWLLHGYYEYHSKL